MKMPRAVSLVMIAACAALLAACGGPQDQPLPAQTLTIMPLPSKEPTQTETPTEAPTEAQVPRFDNPKSFNQSGAAALGVAIDMTTAILSDSTIYSGMGDQVMAIDGPTGQVAWVQSVGSPQAGSSWTCWSLGAGASAIYAVGESPAANHDAPMLVQATAFDKATGKVLWTNKLTSTTNGRPTECGLDMALGVQETPFGVLIAQAEINDSGDNTAMRSYMFDAGNGSPRWQATGLVSGGSGRYGIMVDSTRVRAFDLSAGTPAGTFSANLPAGAAPATAHLIGQNGDTLVVMTSLVTWQGDVPSLAATVYRMSSADGSGQTSGAPVVGDGVSACSGVSGGIMLCYTPQGVTYGIRTDVGTAAWTHEAQAGPTKPIAMGAYFYASVSTGETVLNASTGAVVTELSPSIALLSNEGAVFVTTDGVYSFAAATG